MSAERSSGFFTLVSPAGDKINKQLFTVSHTKADQPLDVVGEHEHMMWDEFDPGTPLHHFGAVAIIWTQ